MARILVRRGRAQGVTRAALVAALVVCASPASAQTQDNPANPRRPFRKLFTMSAATSHTCRRGTRCCGSRSAAPPRLPCIRSTRPECAAGGRRRGGVLRAGQDRRTRLRAVRGRGSHLHVGKLAKKPRVVHIGVDLIRTHIVAYALTFALKSAVRRGRPDHSNHRSFPSGHASATFATATVLHRHFGLAWRDCVSAGELCGGLTPSREPSFPLGRRVWRHAWAGRRAHGDAAWQEQLAGHHRADTRRRHARAGKGRQLRYPLSA